jgi:serine/threonine protein kinase
MSLTAGFMLNNRYRIVTLLGEGGFGAVYRAWDVNLNMSCAVKENFETSPQAAKQFALEAQILASLRHPQLTARDRLFHHTKSGAILSDGFCGGRRSAIHAR